MLKLGYLSWFHV